jgi:hypothetical protein
VDPRDSFHLDFAATVAALVPLILIVSAVEAELARDWARRRLPDGGRLSGWRLIIPLAIALTMLGTGFAALMISVVQLYVGTNRFDKVVLGLVLVPVRGLLVHLVSRIVRQLSECYNAPPSAAACREADANAQ